MTMEQVLIDGAWVDADAAGSFKVTNPATGDSTGETFPISSWNDADRALTAAEGAFDAMRSCEPTAPAAFLRAYADAIDAAKQQLAELAHREKAMPVSPRFTDVEIPRTTNQLRLAADQAERGDWALATIDTAQNLRSAYSAIGPVVIFGPNNFPFAFNEISGGDFAAAIAAGNPVIAKAHPTHAGTTRELAKLAQQCLVEAGLPSGTVQMLYGLSNEDGLRLVADPRIKAVGFTGSRRAGLAIKAACDRVGTPAYLEMSSTNPVIILPGAVEQRSAQLVDEFVNSATLGSGMFCTNPGLIFMLAGEATEAFIHHVATGLLDKPSGTLLAEAVLDDLTRSVTTLINAGAVVHAGGEPATDKRCTFRNTLLRIDGSAFLNDPATFQTEAYGTATLIVVAADLAELAACCRALEGNLTGCLYSAADGSDDAMYARVAPILRQRVGRLINDKMPTGVAVSAAMNHGGPYPATGHPGFTAVGVPGSIRRFAALHSYDNVRPDRLPTLLQDANPTGRTQRLIDGTWTMNAVE